MWDPVAVSKNAMLSRVYQHEKIGKEKEKLAWNQRMETVYRNKFFGK